MTCRCWLGFGPCHGSCHRSASPCNASVMQRLDCWTSTLTSLEMSAVADLTRSAVIVACVAIRCHWLAGGSAMVARRQGAEHWSASALRAFASLQSYSALDRRRLNCIPPFLPGFADQAMSQHVRASDVVEVTRAAPTADNFSLTG
ncbi:hypothetical protein CBM2592_U10001 [Cupriavidus taiwanensis]|nr:hypothetical protein CBM2592_U10001 [Cupriavidus taiwanensis]SOZ00952.1 hypothetical protein CBM2591_U10001 [Cupriavidus taiwanensis]